MISRIRRKLVHRQYVVRTATGDAARGAEHDIAVPPVSEPAADWESVNKALLGEPGFVLPPVAPLDPGAEDGGWDMIIG